MDMGYYGKDGNISEATGYVMYNEDNLNGEKLQDVLKTPEAIEEFKKANELDDAEFDKACIIFSTPFASFTCVPLHLGQKRYLYAIFSPPFFLAG